LLDGLVHDRILPPDGVCGVPGALYATVRVEAALGLRLPASVLLAARLATPAAPTASDVALGAAGTRLALAAALRSATGDRADLRDVIVARLAQLSAGGLPPSTAVSTSVRAPCASSSLSALPGVHVAAALATVSQGDALDVDALVAYVAATEPSVGNVVGVVRLLGLLGAGARVGVLRTVEAMAESVLLNVEHQSPSPSLDALAVTTAVWECTGRTHWRDAAHAVATAIVRRGSAGAWLSPSVAKDTTILSGLVGLAGMAHAVLRLHDRSAVPSLRTMV
jgi:hypothetical protein